jgi:sulfur-carrier protein adenylyltransferase/sulfurtransferase
MPDGDDPSNPEAARAALQAAMAAWGAAALSRNELGRYQRRRPVAGWRLDVDFKGDHRRLDVLIDGDFPRALARVALVESPPFLTWPHIEQDGVLCAAPASTEVSPYQPLAAVEAIIGDACALIEGLAAGRHREDFLSEFASYWNWAASENAPVLRSILKPRGPSRQIVVWRGKAFTLVGESEEALSHWLSNLGIRHKDGRPLTFEEGVLVWRALPLTPTEYPDNARRLLAMADDEAGALLQAQAAKGPRWLNVIVGAPSENGPCLAGVVLGSPLMNPRRPGDRSQPLEAGYRPHGAPEALVSGRYLSAARLFRAPVDRADAAWVHGRDQDLRQRSLSGAKVTVLGCGSIGSPVSRMLAQAGVGFMRLVDGETLTYANTGRHELGVEDVGRNKAKAMAARLGRAYPHMTLEAHACRWENLPPEIDIFDGDLIISAIGGWSAEGALNARHLREDRYPPVLYAWTEAHACAGHAVLVGRAGGCLQCQLSAFGEPKLRVTTGDDALRQEPACGALFQPYGPIELANCVSLAAELSLDWLLEEVDAGLHRIWVARESHLRRTHREWSPEWLGARPRDGGGYIHERSWDLAPECPQCRARAAA